MGQSNSRRGRSGSRHRRPSGTTRLAQVDKQMAKHRRGSVRPPTQSKISAAPPRHALPSSHMQPQRQHAHLPAAHPFVPPPAMQAAAAGRCVLPPPPQAASLQAPATQPTQPHMQTPVCKGMAAHNEAYPRPSMPAACAMPPGAAGDHHRGILASVAAAAAAAATDASLLHSHRSLTTTTTTLPVSATTVNTTTAVVAATPDHGVTRSASKSVLRRRSSVRLRLEASVVLDADTTIAPPAGSALLQPAPSASILKRREVPQRQTPSRGPLTAPTQDLDMVMRMTATPQQQHQQDWQDGQHQRLTLSRAASNVQVIQTSHLLQQDGSGDAYALLSKAATSAELRSSMAALGANNGNVLSTLYGNNDDNNNNNNMHDTVALASSATPRMLRRSVLQQDEPLARRARGAWHRGTTLVVYELPLRIHGRGSVAAGAGSSGGRRSSARHAAMSDAAIAAQEAEDMANYAVRTYGDDCTLIKVTTPVTGEVLSFKVHELVAHTGGATLSRCAVVHKAQSMFMAGYSVALLAMDSATLAAGTTAQPLQTPSFAAVRLLILDTIEAVQARRNGVRSNNNNNNNNNSNNNGSAKSNGNGGASHTHASTATEAAAPTDVALYMSIVLVQQQSPPAAREQPRSPCLRRCHRRPGSGGSSDNDNGEDDSDEVGVDAAMCVDLLAASTDNDAATRASHRTSSASPMADYAAQYLSPTTATATATAAYDDHNDDDNDSDVTAVPLVCSASMAGLCSVRVGGVHYRRIDDVKSFRAACTDARVSAARYADDVVTTHTVVARDDAVAAHDGVARVQSRADGGGTYNDTQKACVLTCILVQSRGDATTLAEAAVSPASVHAHRDTHSCDSDDDDDLSWRPTPPFVVRDNNNNDNGGEGGDTTAACDDLVVSCLTCVCADALPWLAATLAGDAGSDSEHDNSNGAPQPRVWVRRSSNDNMRSRCSVPSYLQAVFDSVSHCSVVLGVDPLDAHAYSALELQRRLAATPRRRASRGSLRRCMRRLQYKQQQQQHEDETASPTRASSPSARGGGGARASALALRALAHAVASDTVADYLTNY